LFARYKEKSELCQIANLKGAFRDQAFIVEEAWRRRFPEFNQMKHWYQAKRIGEAAMAIQVLKLILLAQPDYHSKPPLMRQRA
jgi:hypothetical protein